MEFIADLPKIFALLWFMDHFINRKISNLKFIYVIGDISYLKIKKNLNIFSF